MGRRPGRQPRLFAAFHAMLGPGGRVCPADLDAEDGSFHGPEVEVHHGVARATVRTWLAAAGVAAVKVADCRRIAQHGQR